MLFSPLKHSEKVFTFIIERFYGYERRRFNYHSLSGLRARYASKDRTCNNIRKNEMSMLRQKFFPRAASRFQGIGERKMYKSIGPEQSGAGISGSESGKPELKRLETLYCFGVRCPNCQALLVTPKGFELVAGIGKCTHCNSEFLVTFENTIEARERRVACQTCRCVYETD